LTADEFEETERARKNVTKSPLKDHLTIGVENIFAFCAAIYIFFRMGQPKRFEEDFNYHFRVVIKLPICQYRIEQPLLEENLRHKSLVALQHY
jgi:hypothetical protein